MVNWMLLNVAIAFSWVLLLGLAISAALYGQWILLTIIVSVVTSLLLSISAAQNPRI